MGGDDIYEEEKDNEIMEALTISHSPVFGVFRIKDEIASSPA